MGVATYRSDFLARLVLISNRVVELGKAAQAGGVAVVIADILRARGGLWFGWSGSITEDRALISAPAKVTRSKSHSQVATVPLSSGEHRDYYLGYSNSVLWPVFHNRLDLAQFDAGYYPSYVDVNERFADALVPLLRADDVLWIHDYHLIPLAAALRRRGAENAIGFFLHIPVPPWQTFLAIPEHRELARAFSAYDLVGLQTKADVANLIKFLEDGAAGRILQDGHIRVFDRELAVESFPVGIDLSEFADTASTGGRAPDGPQRIIGVDRLDYTKGLPQKLTAFGRFLEKYPAYRGKVVLSQIAPPTRESVEAYTDIRRTLEAMSGKINGMFGELDWVPIHYIHRSAPRRRLREIYRGSRIGMFTPLRDGMNLVAKEYIAAQDPDDPGVVILSRFAGAAEQLVDALIVNPYNVEEMADAIRIALEMDKPERIRRHARLLAAIKAHDTMAWQQSFIGALETCVGRRRMTDAASPSIDSALESLNRAANGSGRRLPLGGAGKRAGKRSIKA
jgi:trehalose 6-phosphate synthase